MLAVIKTGGKQYKAEIGQKLTIEKVAAEAGDSFEIKEVMLISDKDGEIVKTGTPLVDGAAVQVKVIEHIKDKKIIVFKKKRRQGYRRKQGHRQELSTVEVINIKSK